LRSNLATILIIRINLYCKIRICGNEQSYENKKEEAEKVGKEADKLNKNLDDKYNEIMEFIEEVF